MKGKGRKRLNEKKMYRRFSVCVDERGRAGANLLSL